MTSRHKNDPNQMINQDSPFKLSHYNWACSQKKERLEKPFQDKTICSYLRELHYQVSNYLQQIFYSVQLFLEN